MNDLPRFSYLAARGLFKEVDEHKSFSCSLPFTRNKIMYYIIEVFYQEHKSTPKWSEKLEEYRQCSFDYIAYNVESKERMIDNKYNGSDFKWWQKEIDALSNHLDELESLDEIRNILTEMPDIDTNYYQITLDGISDDMKNWFLYHSHFFEIVYEINEYFDYFARGYENSLVEVTNTGLGFFLCCFLLIISLGIFPLFWIFLKETFIKESLKAVYLYEIAPRIFKEYFNKRRLTFFTQRAFNEDNTLKEWIGYYLSSELTSRNAYKFIDICSSMSERQRTRLEKNNELLWKRFARCRDSRSFVYGFSPM